MTTLRKAAAQALDALTKIHPGNMSWETCVAWLNAVQILREALAEPEPEPVAWMDRDGDIYPMPETEGWRPPHKLLYTHPPQHQEANPVVWQFRMRPDWVLDKDFWGPWTNCTKEQAADYQRVPHLHDWKYEVRLLYTHPPQHPTETEAEYGSEADTEELLRVGAMPEPLRFAAMLEKTMQWPLHGIAADCLRRMHNEAQRKPLTDEEIDKVTDAQWAQNNHKPIYAAHRAYARAIEQEHGIEGEE